MMSLHYFSLISKCFNLLVKKISIILPIYYIIPLYNFIIFSIILKDIVYSLCCSQKILILVFFFVYLIIWIIIFIDNNIIWIIYNKLFSLFNSLDGHLIILCKLLTTTSAPKLNLRYLINYYIKIKLLNFTKIIWSL